MENITLLNFMTFMETFAFLAGMQGLIIMAACYLKRQPSADVKGINFVIFGFVSLIASVFFVLLRLWYDFVGFTLLEMAAFSVSVGFLISSGLILKGVKAVSYPLVGVFAVILLLFLIYAIYLSPAEYLVYVLHYLPLGVAYCFVAVGFCPKSERKSIYGFYVLSLSFLLLAVLTFLMIFGWGRNFFGVNAFTVVYFFNALGFMLAGTNLLEDKIDALGNEVKDSADRFRLIIQSSPFPIIISRLKDERVILVNRKAEQLLGVDINKLRSYRISDFFDEKTFKKELMERLKNSNQIEDFEVQLSGKKAPPNSAGAWLQISTHVIDFEYEIALYSAVQDITERKKKEMELFYEATRDSLTDCYNRRFFEELAGNEMRRSKRYNRPFCLLMIDADHFKAVNDTYGHDVGDKVLKALAETCAKVLRKSDIICRFGGEEFMIMLMEIELDIAKIVCDRLRKAIEQVIVKGNKNEDVRFTVSMGLVPSSYSTNYDELIKAVDEALYIAKKAGRNRLIAITPKVDAKPLKKADETPQLPTEKPVPEKTPPDKSRKAIKSEPMQPEDVSESETFAL